jgi:Fic family protein
MVEAAGVEPVRILGDCCFRQGKLLTRMNSLELDARQQARAEIIVQEALKTFEIEGERLDPSAVRLSVARRLGLPTAGLPSKNDRQADGVVDILLDATLNHKEALTTQRLFGWHAALFPTGYSGIHKILVASWRDDHSGPMQVVSGPIGREEIHYQAPPAMQLANEMNKTHRPRLKNAKKKSSTACWSPVQEVSRAG